MPCGDFDDTLLRLQNNDPTLTSLNITSFSHPDPADWETLGNAVGGNSSLESISFCTSFVEPAAFDYQTFELLREGLRRNTSINNVRFLWGGTPSFLGSICQCLSPFLAKRELKRISFEFCRFDPSSCTLIGGVLARCTFLYEIEFSNNCFDEETSAEIIKSLGGMTSLAFIRISRSGVWAGWDFLINHLRFSNHTLQSIEYRGGDRMLRELPQDVNTLLNMNRMEDKNALAIQKGLFFNFLVGKFDATPYDDIEEELKPKLLPHVLATVGGGENGDGRSEEHRRSALFHCIQNMAADLNPNTI